MGHPRPISCEQIGDLTYYREIERFQRRSGSQRDHLETERQEQRRREEREEHRRTHQARQGQRHAAQQQREGEQEQEQEQEEQRRAARQLREQEGEQEAQPAPTIRWLPPRHQDVETQQQQSRGQVTADFNHRQHIAQRGQDEPWQILQASAAQNQQGPSGLVRSLRDVSVLSSFELHCARVRAARRDFQSREDTVPAKRSELAARREAVRVGETARDNQLNDEVNIIATQTRISNNIPDARSLVPPQGQQPSIQSPATIAPSQDQTTSPTIPNPPTADPEPRLEPRRNRSLLSLEELACLPGPRYIPGERLYPAPDIEESQLPPMNLYRLPSYRTWETIVDVRQTLPDNVEEQVRHAAHEREHLRVLLQSLISRLDGRREPRR
ncbi:hypothetical protein QC761_0086710 [Podospora bellae-mahoneyi]|uniref:Uncharacterized protein n=1 Tax=Podospora bellae-mahoneyi TaxID=2093777 RepID=A0ABR0FG18_9PEZI|nr:hypothetical protein QC761_0086710 [Podospora bellae-mahoneyi]